MKTEYRIAHSFPSFMPAQTNTASRWFLQGSVSLFLAISLWFGVFGSARAEELIISGSIPATETDWAKSLSLAKFNPNNGILIGVQVTLTASLGGEIFYENTSPAPNTMTLTHRSTLSVSSLGLGGIAQLNPAASVVVAAPAYDGVGGFNPDGTANFGGSSGGQRMVQEQAVALAAYAAANELALFSGNDTIDFSVSATGLSGMIDSTGNVDTLFTGNKAGITITILYRYTAATVEQPRIALSKYTNGADANAAHGLDVPQLAPGEPLTWSYRITNTGSIAIPKASLLITDSQPGVTPSWLSSSDAGNDQILSPDESWEYRVNALAQNLKQPTPGTAIVRGCGPTGVDGPGARPTYVNIAVATALGASASDSSHYCNPFNPKIRLEVTVYSGHNKGASCPGGEVVQSVEERPVTFCFEVTNQGDTYLNAITLSDRVLGITEADVTRLSGSTVLAPGGKQVYYYETTLRTSRMGATTTEGNPTDENGADIPKMANVSDDDGAAIVRLQPTALEESPEIMPSRLYLPWVAKGGK
jgi:hypothetical protein